MKIGYVRVSTEEQNTARQDAMMQELGVEVTLFGVDMELLGYNCGVNFDEYQGLYFDTYGNWAAKNVIRR